PVWVGGDRTHAARAAVDAGAGALVLDDGFQDPSLAKDLSIVVVDGRFGFGNGFLIPAGPLRESLRAGLARADALVVIGDDVWGVADAARRFGPKDLPVLTARVVPGPEIEQISKVLGVAFAGIGHPEKFFQTLRDHGCRLAGTKAFPDHHLFSSADLAALKRCAEALKGVLITTEKDAQRIPAGDRAGIEVLTITLQWDDEAALDRLLQTVKP
ncbi:MAG TPA: tetraacyldisaccharide 4'-kinase, partial [Rhodospirillaceae bacterium]|nr:tetraacyldisaccharide 4'-kinase [Rhodospirillaceae bacterium]